LALLHNSASVRAMVGFPVYAEYKLTRTGSQWRFIILDCT
jgi:hypothetical protein